jgi:hypothetical protein
MFRSILGLLAAFGLAGTALASELDREFKGTGKAPAPVVKQTDAPASPIAKGSELDDEEPAQAHRRWYGGWYGGYRGWYGGYRGWYGGYGGWGRGWYAPRYGYSYFPAYRHYGFYPRYYSYPAFSFSIASAYYPSYGYWGGYGGHYCW